MTAPSSKRVARALLETFSQDEVPARAKERAFVAFGVAAGVTGISTMATGGATGTAVGAAAPAAALVAKTAATVSALSLLKAVIAGAALGVITVQAGDRVAARSHEARPANQPAAIEDADERTAHMRSVPSRGLARANPALSVAAPLVQGEHGAEPFGTDRSPADLALPRPAPSAPVQSSRARTPARAHVEADRSAGAAPAPSLAADETPAAIPNAAPTASAGLSAAATLTGEIARLDRARAALRQGAPARALWELDGYDAEFANGSFRQEAAVLRIEVLVETGEDVRAHALANAFATAHPTSGYLTKIGELLGRGRKRPAP